MKDLKKKSKILELVLQEKEKDIFERRDQTLHNMNLWRIDLCKINFGDFFKFGQICKTISIQNVIIRNPNSPQKHILSSRFEIIYPHKISQKFHFQKYVQVKINLHEGEQIFFTLLKFEEKSRVTDHFLQIL